MKIIDEVKLALLATINSRISISLATLLVLSATTACTAPAAKDDKKSAAVDASRPIQIGWMTSWATTGQIMQALNHTNITDLYGVPVVLHSFLFGPDIYEAALHGEIDCVNNGLVPTISLLAASSDWVVVGRLVDSPLSVVARKGSHVESIQDLKGKSIAVPFGGGSHPYVVDLLAKNDLQIGEGSDKVKLVNLKPSEQAIAMAQGSVAAVGTWEPQTAIMLAKGLGKVIHSERHIGVITVRKSIADNDPAKVINLLKSYIQANHYVATHSNEADQWYLAAAQMDPKVLPFISVIEPNLKAVKPTDVNIELQAQDLALAQRFADSMLKAELIPAAVDFNGRTNPSYLQKAISELNADKFKTDEVREVGEHR